ncbi:hypothetical protein V3C99_000557, partial [Haemonchus contortus]
MNKIAPNLHTSRRSVQNIVKCGLDFHSYRFFRGQMLSEAAKKNSLEKCQKLLAAVRAGRLSDISCGQTRKFSRSRSRTTAKTSGSCPSGREKLQKTTSENHQPVP